MDEFTARRVIDSLRDHDVDAHLFRAGIGHFGVRVPPEGYMPRIEGSEDFDELRIVDAIVRTDYEQPVELQRTVAPTPAPAFPRRLPPPVTHPPEWAWRALADEWRTEIAARRTGS